MNIVNLCPNEIRFKDLNGVQHILPPVDWYIHTHKSGVRVEDSPPIAIFVTEYEVLGLPGEDKNWRSLDPEFRPYYLIPSWLLVVLQLQGCKRPDLIAPIQEDPMCLPRNNKGSPGEVFRFQGLSV